MNLRFLNSAYNLPHLKKVSNLGNNYSSSNYEVILYPTLCEKSEYFLYREYGGYEKKGYNLL